MPAEVLLRPDIELMVVTWLGDQLRSDGITAVNHLDKGWENLDLPLVQASRSGGRPSNTLLDEPRVDFDCYTDSETTTPKAASELARVVEALLPAIKGARIVDPDGAQIPGVITDVGIESGPSWRPDFNPKVYRYGLTALFVVRHSKPRP